MGSLWEGSPAIWGPWRNPFSILSLGHPSCCRQAVPKIIAWQWWFFQKGISTTKSQKHLSERERSGRYKISWNKGQQRSFGARSRRINKNVMSNLLVFFHLPILVGGWNFAVERPEKKWPNCCLPFIGDEILRRKSYPVKVGIIVNHYFRIPTKQPVFHGK